MVVLNMMAGWHWLAGRWLEDGRWQGARGLKLLAGGWQGRAGQGAGGWKMAGCKRIEDFGWRREAAGWIVGRADWMPVLCGLASQLVAN